MIYKRVAARLRAQDWLAITIELAIVILGVFIGTQVSNWNAERLEKRETQRMIGQLGPTLAQLSDYYRHAHPYYDTTRAYGATAIAGWRRDPKVSDADFVIAAYQASQIFTLGISGTTWSTALGADQLRNVDDPELRSNLIFLMTADYSQTDSLTLDTPYRHNVRRIIPIEIQDTIRAQCGDQRSAGNSNALILPTQCRLIIAPQDAASAATALRAHPELLEDLQFHLAAIAAFISNIVPLEQAARRVEQLSGAKQKSETL